jgi:hypothetical protein
MGTPLPSTKSLVLGIDGMVDKGVFVETKVGDGEMTVALAQAVNKINKIKMGVFNVIVLKTIRFSIAKFA